MDKLQIELESICTHLTINEGSQADVKEAVSDIFNRFKDAGYIREVDVSVPAFNPYKPTKGEL